MSKDREFVQMYLSIKPIVAQLPESSYTECKQGPLCNLLLIYM